MSKSKIQGEIPVLEDRLSHEDLRRRYFQLIKALGADVKTATHEDALHVAEVLNRVKTSIIHNRPDETGAMFICGASDEVDADDLPNRVMICPTMGVNGFAVYKKERDWRDFSGS